MSTSEAAVRLGVAVKTITRWAVEGRLTPKGKLPGRTGAWIFSASEVESLAERIEDHEAHK
ncbi:MAG: helix-turn-helix domain-containing protein [Pseudoclavibacter sp.]